MLCRSRSCGVMGPPPRPMASSSVPPSAAMPPAISMPAMGTTRAQPHAHLSDHHGPHSVKVMSATHHEAPYVLDGLLDHGTMLRLDTHYTDTGRAFRPRLHPVRSSRFPLLPAAASERKLACLAPASTYPYLQPLLGQRIKTEVIREHWNEAIRLVASLKAGTVVPSAMLRKLAAYRRHKQLDLALQELATGWRARRLAGARRPGPQRAESSQ